MKIDLALAGCRPEPLGSYLRALAVLRLVGEQKDPTAKGYWNDDVFHLVSELDGAALVEFFAVDYAPTPIVGPWGARSGFFAGSSERSAREALLAVEKSTLVRFRSFCATIGAVRACLVARRMTAKATDDEKLALLSALRNTLPDVSLRWLDAAYVLGNRARERGYPIVLGTGGNEGSQGFSSTFMQALCDLGFLTSSVDPAAVRGSIFGCVSQSATEAPTGQFAPGLTRGVNQGPGFSGGPSASAFDMILTFEGAATWVSGATKREGPSSPSRLSSPFTVRSRSVAFNGAANDDGKARGEIWAPLWSRRASSQELEALLSEARAQWSAHAARTAMDMAKAAGSLGVDRGIDGFERYALMDRNGKSYFAVGAGRFNVFQRSEADLIRELDGALESLDRHLGKLGDRAPGRLVSVRRSLDEALFAALRTPGERRLLNLLRAIGRTEAVLATLDGGRKVLKAPLGGLSLNWLRSAEDCLELRIAAALASISGNSEIGPLRANLIPIDAQRTFAYGVGPCQVAWEGNTLAARMGSLIRRRLIDYERFSCERLPLTSSVALALEDVVAFIEGRIDETLLEELLFGLTWVDWRKRDRFKQVRASWEAPIARTAIPPVYALMKSVLDPRLESCEPRIVPLLLAGRVERAIEMATVRLRVADLCPVNFAPVGRPFRMIRNVSIDPIRLAASLLIPVRNPGGLLRLVTHAPPEERKEA